MAIVVDVMRRGLRGGWLVAVLFIAGSGLVAGSDAVNGQGVRGLVDRVGADP